MAAVYIGVAADDVADFMREYGDEGPCSAQRQLPMATNGAQYAGWP
jgi:hypothetical protein